MIKILRKINLYITDYIIRKKGGILISSLIANSPIFGLILPIRKDGRVALSDFEYFHLCEMIKKSEKIEGDIAEVGVYKGGSAKVICETTKKQVHLFDTFEGLPDVTNEDDSSQFKKGEYKGSYNDVKDYLKEYSNVQLYKGLFPSTGRQIEDKKFSLIHLDVDIYKSTLDCLEFFYTKMTKGGVIISHDYTYAKGVRKAFDEFFKNKPEIVFVPLAGTSQCFVVKV
jgi:hypothetical protein